MSLESFIQAMPKVELHVHLEGAIAPRTLLQLARRHSIQLPADTVDGLRAWYAFRDFAHFIEVYLAVSSCIRTAEDVELVAREFLQEQAAQRIVYSEATWTAFTHWHFKGLAVTEQLAALGRAADWAERTLGTRMRLVLDIVRTRSAEEGVMIAEWAIAAGDRVVALGLGGPEAGHPPEPYHEAFARATAAGLASVPHAGETAGPESIWGALRTLRADRIGHGVRCLEDPALVEELRRRQVPLEVCPTSNVRLGVVPRLEDHPLPRLLAEGLYVTLNSDDPCLFGATLTDEYRMAARTFGLGAKALERLVLNAVRVALLPAEEKQQLEAELTAEFGRLRSEHGVGGGN